MPHEIRPPPPPLHTPIPKHAAKTPELSRFHGVRSAASSIKSRGKSSNSGSQRVTDAGKSAGSSYRAHGHGHSHGASSSANEPWQGDLSSSKLSTLDALGFTVTMSSQGDQLCLPDVLARSDDYDDLSELPRPKRILPRRDVPWVFRFKVKKEMNALARIMASKPNAIGSVTATGPTA
nr:hypothetical protein BaRGS_023187 [Batillaria attramentaria]